MRPLALSLGDPAGVGPELICAAWARRREEALPPFFAVQGVHLLAAAAEAAGLDIPIRPIADPAEAAEVFGHALPVIGGADGVYRPGEPDPAGARLALVSLTHAARHAAQGRATGLVTGPIAKGRLAEVGFEFPGQTEFVAAATGTLPEAAVMMLAGPTVRTVPLTVHVALAQVPRLLNIGLVTRRTRIVAKALHRDFGLANPRIAVAALNPHAGEDGRFGREDTDIVAPAIAALREEGLDVSGPHPADTLFAPHIRTRYDAMVCMYHDQALIPVKALDFDQGVNVTLGLPIVRTSPDHGTAFDIAGTGSADPGATIAAIRMAGACAARRATA